MKFEDLIPTDRIIITDNMNREIKTITNKDKIREIVDFTIDHGSNWGVPFYGAPVAKLSANFYIENRFVGDLGVGSNFLTAQGCRYFQSRRVSPKDRRKIIQLIDAGDPYQIEK